MGRAGCGVCGACSGFSTHGDFLFLPGGGHPLIRTAWLLTVPRDEGVLKSSGRLSDE
jgi:hypothetical protein